MTDQPNNKEVADICVQRLKELIKTIEDNPDRAIHALVLNLARETGKGDTLEFQTLTMGHDKVLVAATEALVLETAKTACKDHKCGDKDCPLDTNHEAPVIVHIMDQLYKYLSLHHSAYTLEHLKDRRKKFKKVIALLEEKIELDKRAGEPLPAPILEALRQMGGNAKAIKITPENFNEMHGLLQALAKASGDQEFAKTIDEMAEAVGEKDKDEPLPKDTIRIKNSSTTKN